MKQNWTVLLIGGSSGAGKTYLARQLAERYEMSHMEADDIRVALRTVTNREEHPELFTFVDHQNYLEEFTQEQFVERTLEVSSTVWMALNDVITKHVGFNERIVIEGDSIVPDLLAQCEQEGVKAIFIYDDLEHIRERQLKRNRNKKRTPEKMEINARFSFAYSETLRTQAEKCGLTTIKASPVESLVERAITSLELE